MNIKPPSRAKTDELINNIIKDCYWDYNIKPDDIYRIINSEELRHKQKLFRKIIYNSQNRLEALLLFQKDDLKKLFDSFSPGSNDTRITRHILILRNIFFDEKNPVEGLEWKKT